MKQRGFSLTELAIVLAIIAVALLSILNSQGLTSSANAKNVVAIVDDLRTATVLFKQKYNYLPGDLPPPSNEFPGVTNVGNGDGSIGVTDDINAQGKALAGKESAVAPVQLFSAGLIGKINGSSITTDYGSVNLVSNAIADGLITGYTAANPASQNAILFFNLPCDVVYEVDNKIDDGNYLTGHAIGTVCTNNIVQWYAVPL